MAVRLNPRNQEAVRNKIRIGQLVELLQNHAVKGKALEASRIDCAKFLINKVLSNPATEVIQQGNVTLTWQD